MVNSWQQKTESSQPKGISEQEWGTGWLHCLLFCKNLPGAEPQEIYESSRQTWFTKETMPGLNSQHWRAENGTFAQLQGSWRRCCWDLWLPAGPVWGWWARAGPGLFQNLPHMNNDYSVMMYVSGVISKVPPCCPPQPLICSCGPRASTSLGWTRKYIFLCLSFALLKHHQTLQHSFLNVFHPWPLSTREIFMSVLWSSIK